MHIVFLGATCLPRRQLVWNVKVCFLGKIKKKNLKKIEMSSAEISIQYAKAVKQ